MLADVDQPPRAHLVLLRIGATQNPGLESRLLAGCEPFRPAGAGPIVQAGRPFGIEPDHRIPEGLAFHPGEPRGLSASEAVKRMGNR